MVSLIEFLFYINMNTPTFWLLMVNFVLKNILTNKSIKIILIDLFFNKRNGYAYNNITNTFDLKIAHFMFNGSLNFFIYKCVKWHKKVGFFNVLFLSISTNIQNNSNFYLYHITINFVKKHTRFKSSWRSYFDILTINYFLLKQIQ